MVDLHIKTVIVVGKPDHDDLVHRPAIHVQGDPAPALHLLMGILFAPAGEVCDLYLPVLRGNQILHHVSVLIRSQSQAHGLEFLISVIDALPEHIKVNLVILDIESGSDIQQFISVTGRDSVIMDSLCRGQRICLNHSTVDI